ncbi:MAG: response regulator [Nitrospira sp.]
MMTITVELWDEEIESHLRWLQGSARMRRDQRENQSSNGRRVLIIDDDENMRAVLCDWLQVLGFEVLEASNGYFGLVHIAFDAHQNPIHGILLDLRMPVLGGMAVLQELRQRHGQIPVIVMSDFEDIHSVREAIQLGAQEYLLKPFDLELVRTKCLQLFYE